MKDNTVRVEDIVMWLSGQCMLYAEQNRILSEDLGMLLNQSTPVYSEIKALEPAHKDQAIYTRIMYDEDAPGSKWVAELLKRVPGELDEILYRAYGTSLMLALTALNKKVDEGDKLS